MNNNGKPSVIIGQTTDDIRQSIEAAALKNYSHAFEFKRAGNTKRYNKSGGRKPNK